jgi:lipopolysaccharide O-acetyltransferase
VGLRLDAFPSSDKVVLIIGDNVQINDYVHIAAIEEVSIGDHTLIASKVFIADHHHGEYRLPDLASSPEVPPNSRPLVARAVFIGQRVWIGEQVCILPGVTIGNGAIIGA